MESNEWSGGWKVVFAGAVGMGTGVGLYTMVAGLFFVPIEAEFGWSRGSIASAALLTVFGSLFLPLLGGIIDRVGVKSVAVCGALLLSLSYFLMTQITESIWTFYVAIFLVMLAGLATGPLVYTKAVNRCFSRHRGIALGLTLSGVTVTAIIGIPLISYIIETAGWRLAFVVLGMLPVCIGLPFIWFWLDKRVAFPLEAENGVGYTVKEEKGSTLNQALLSRKFWFLASGLLLANIAVGGMLSQMQPILYEIGLDPSVASLFGSLFAVSIAMGRLSSGFLLDKWWAPGVASAYLVLPIVGLCLLMFSENTGLSLVAIAVVLIGLAQGAEIDFMSFLVPRYFGLLHYGAIFGVLAMFVSIALGMGGMWFGMVFDIYGSYSVALQVSVFCYLGGALLVLASGLCGTESNASSVQSELH